MMLIPECASSSSCRRRRDSAMDALARLLVAVLFATAAAGASAQVRTIALVAWIPSQCIKLEVAASEALFAPPLRHLALHNGSMPERDMIGWNCLIGIDEMRI